ncbi:MAG: hypothetical protein LBO75_04975, partial [Bifidobacteriaceae bacterium]|nr:hypothetical protein [Bifidobacteriaceae bacterium]
MAHRGALRSEVPILASQLVGSAAAAVGLSAGVLLADDVTDSPIAATFIRASSWFAAALFAKPLSELSARWGRRTGLVVGWALACLGAGLVLVSALNGSVAAITGGMVLGGAGAAAMLQARFAISEVLPPPKRTGAIVRLTWIGASGSVIGPSLLALGTVFPRP